MAIAALTNHNPFVVPLLLLALLLAARFYLLKHPTSTLSPVARRIGRRSILVLGALLGALAVLSPAFETYFRAFSCEVSAEYMSENAALARRALAVLAAHSIPTWLDYATLLNQLRGEQLNRWEQDVDVSLLHPAYMHAMRNMPLMADGGLLGPALDAARADPSAPGLALSVEHLLEKMRAAGFIVTYKPESNGREFVQLWGPGVRREGPWPHVDLWLWAPIAAGAAKAYPPVPSADQQFHWASAEEGEAGQALEPMLYTGEHASYNPRALRDIFPLQNASWLGAAPGSVWLPREPHRVSQAEYGGWGGSYMTPQVFRGDCFHNFFNARFAY